MSLDQPACPRCGAALGPLGDPASAPVTTCPVCGHQMATQYLVEAADLDQWHAWAGHRLAWVSDTAAP